jgi:hypothetical protein
MELITRQVNVEKENSDKNKIVERNVNLGGLTAQKYGELKEDSENYTDILREIISNNKVQITFLKMR